MKEGDEKFYKIFHNHLVGMILTDTNQQITDINDHLLQLLEMERKDVIGKTGIELGLLDEEFISKMQQRVSETGTGMVSGIELSFSTKSKNNISILFSTQQIEINAREHWLTTIIDISKKKEAEEKISGSELRFRTLTKTAPVGIFETDASGYTTYVNEAWMQYSGMKLEEALGDGWLNAVHPEDREWLKKGWYSKTKITEESSSEYRIIDKKGNHRWVNGRAVPLINGKGAISGYMGTISDVTVIKQALELLKESEETLNKAQSISKVGSWEWNILTGELSWSKEQYRIFELEGHPSETLFEAYRKKYHPDDLYKLDEVIKNGLEKGEGFTYEHRIICNDGSIKYILGIGEAILDANGKVTSLKGTGQDITENKKIELEIIQSHQKIDTLINTIDGIVWEANAVSFEFTFISKKAEDILGYPAEQWINEASFWADHIHPEDRNRAVEYCIESAKEKKEYDFEYRMIAKDGSIVWFRDIVTVIVENDVTVQLRGILIDITENKKIENALNERTEQLRELSSYLQEVREEERANIAREIHDELGQQLTGLKMDITWLMKKVLRDDPVIKNKFEDSIKLIDASVKTIRRIATELRPSIIDDLGLNAAFEWQVEDFSKRMGIEMQYQNNFDDTDIDSNASIGLFRILQESLTNIARHARAKKVVISIEKVKGEIRLSIQDDGKGFEPAAKQADNTFGLLGIKERTYMMKGDCEIYSKPGEGTKISIHIPAG